MNEHMKVIPGDDGFSLIEENMPPRLLLGVNMLVVTEPYSSAQLTGQSQAWT